MLILSLPPYCSPPLSYHAPFNHFISPSLPLLSFTFLLCILLILIPIVFCPLYFSPFCPSFLFSFIFYYLSFISKGFVDCVPNISFLSSDFSFSSSLHILSMSYKSWNNFLSSPSSKNAFFSQTFAFTSNLYLFSSSFSPFPSSYILLSTRLSSLFTLSLQYSPGLFLHVHSTLLSLFLPYIFPTSLLPCCPHISLFVLLPPLNLFVSHLLWPFAPLCLNIFSIPLFYVC